MYMLIACLNLAFNCIRLYSYPALLESQRLSMEKTTSGKCMAVRARAAAEFGPTITN